MAPISAAEAASWAVYPPLAAVTPLAVVCVRAVKAAAATSIAALTAFIAAVVAWNGCPDVGGVPTSWELSADHWAAVAASSAGTTCNPCPIATEV